MSKNVEGLIDTKLICDVTSQLKLLQTILNTIEVYEEPVLQLIPSTYS